VVSTLAIAIAILAALGIAVWQAGVARREAMRANAQVKHAEAIRDFLVSVFEAAQTDMPREKRPTVEELVDTASDRALRDTGMASDLRADLLLTLAKVSTAVGAYPRAHALLDRATPDIDAHVPAAGDASLRARVLRASVLLAQAQPVDSAALLEPLQASLVARADDIGVGALLVLANALSGANRYDDAQAVFAKAKAMVDTLPIGRDELAFQIDVAQTESLVYAQKFAAGLALADATWRRWNASHREPDRDALNLLASISTAAEAVGDAGRAESAYRDAIDVAERLYIRPHPDTAWVIGVYGSFLVAHARYAEAEPYVERALTMRHDLLGESHPDTLNAMAALGRLRAGQQRLPDARKAFSDGVAVCVRDHVKHSVCPRLLGSLAQALMNLGELDAAADSASHAVTMQRELTGADSPQLIGVLGFLAKVQVKQQHDTEALQTTDELLRLADRAGSGDSKDARYGRFQRAQALFSLGRNPEALDLVTDVVAAQKEKTPDEKSTLFTMLVLQARALARANRVDDAKAVAREALAMPRKSPADAVVAEGLERLARTGRGY
jgi:serine/threonine-protein kinase